MDATGPRNFRRTIRIIIPKIMACVVPLIMGTAVCPASPHLQPTAIHSAVRALEVTWMRIQALAVASGRSRRCEGQERNNRMGWGRGFLRIQGVKELEGRQHAC